jgi:hypothetical protein
MNSDALSFAGLMIAKFSMSAEDAAALIEAASRPSVSGYGFEEDDNGSWRVFIYHKEE